MDSTQRIITASQRQPERFLGLSMEGSSLGAGKQGTVFSAKNRIGKQYAIKFVRPDPSEPERVKQRTDKFFNELKILSTITNKNIIRVHTGGYCDVSLDDNSIHLVETTEPPTTGNGEYVYFYTMDYFPTALTSLFPIASTHFDPAKSKPVMVESSEEQIMLFEKLVSHISRALDFCHQRELFHNDIKAENILYSRADETFILADFGQAQKKPSSKDNDYIRTWPINHPHYKFKNKSKDNDLYGFSLILFSILEAIKERYDYHRLGALRDILRKATDTHIDSFPFECGTALRNSLRRYFLQTSWSLKLHIGEYLVPSAGRMFLIDSKIRLPVSGSVFTTPEVRAIVDDKDFQRLRGVKQLGPTDFVFPGATHTRFEHSLGTYHLALRYLESLSRVPEFNDICADQTEAIKYTALASLLHDIGHYPYSHWIEEIDEFPHKVAFESHESRASNIIRNGEIGVLIEKHWGVQLEPLLAIIGHGPLSPALSVVKSMVDSVLDVDKLDYLNRDSIHCGVEYGRSLDIARLLEALHVDGENKRICLTHKAKTYLMSLLACRNMMYTDVYWHKTVRALTGMFKYLVYQLVANRVLNQTELDELFKEADVTFVSKLFQRVKESHLPQLLPLIEPFAYKGRDIYRPAFVFSESHTGERPNIVRFCSRMLTARYSELIASSARVRDVLSKDYGPIDEHDVIIEKTPSKMGKERYEIADFRIWNTRRKEFERRPRKVSDLNDFLESNRQIFILCSPKLYPKLRPLTIDNWEGLFGTF